MKAPDLLSLFGRPDRVRELERGEYLFRRDDPASGCFRLEAGRARLVRAHASGHELTLHELFEGSTFAEAAVFGRRFHCDCRADSASRVAVFDRRRVRSALESDPGLALEWAEHLARQVRDQRALLEIRSIPSARERVLSYLEWRSGGTPAEVELNSLRALATALGLADETVYRTVRRLVEDRLIERDRSRLRLVGTSPAG